jgi:hypothetical protein
VSKGFSRNPETSTSFKFLLGKIREGKIREALGHQFGDLTGPANDAAVLRAVTFAPRPNLYLGRAGGTGDGTQPGGSRCDGLDIAQATLELVPFEQHLRAGGTEQPVGRAQRIKSGEMTVTRDQLDQRLRDRLDARLAGALDLADGAADQ